MNTVTIPSLLKQTTFLLSLIGFSLLLSACGGNDKKHTSSSSSSSSSSHIFTPMPITPAGTGIWPDVKVSANGTKALKFEWTSPPADTTYYKLLKSADGALGSYEQIGENFTDLTISDTINVHLTDWLNSRYKIQACTAADVCSGPEIITNSAMLSAITYFKASHPGADDWFGWSIAISGDGQTLAVGAPGEDSASSLDDELKVIPVNGDENNDKSPNSGAVYVFNKDANGNWVQQAYLKASNTEQPDTDPAIVVPFNTRFGYRISLSSDGNTLAVSAIQENVPSFGTNCNQSNSSIVIIGHDENNNDVKGYYPYNIGAVYVFKRIDSQWSQNAYLKPTTYHSERHYQFGNSLALSGDGQTLAIGSALDSFGFLYTNGSSESSTNSNESSISSSNDECRYFSSSDSISSSSSSSKPSAHSSSIDVHAFGGQNSGAVFVYKATENSWTFDRYLKAPDARANSNFGISVALSFDGKTLAVGADGEYLDSNSSAASITKDKISYLVNSGATYIFQYENNEWSPQQKLKASRNLINLQFGNSVAISGDGNTIAVGAPGDVEPNSGINLITDDANLNNAILDTYALNPLNLDYFFNPINETYFLHPLNIDTNKLKIYSGAIYIFTKTEITWSQQAYIKATNPQPKDNFGNCVALSFDGSVLAVGAFGNSSQDKGINGDELDTGALNSGAAYIFTRTSTNWVQKSYVKAPNTHVQDRFGRAIGLDASGETLMIGAYRESSNAIGINASSASSSSAGTASGAVYLY